MKNKFIKTFENFRDFPTHEEMEDKTHAIISNLDNEKLFALAELDFEEEFIDKRDILHAEKIAYVKIINKIKQLISNGVELSEIDFNNGDFDDLY